jgi:hypothetical protein
MSLVSSPFQPGPQTTREVIKRSYRVEVRPPLGQSYAPEIAARYGISYSQLVKASVDRGILPE